jgi:hypothetical protein
VFTVPLVYNIVLLAASRQIAELAAPASSVATVGAFWLMFTAPPLNVFE